MMSPREMDERRTALEERRRERRRMRRKRAIFYILCVLIGMALLIGTAYWSYNHQRALVGAKSNNDPTRLNVLVLGTDSGLGGGARTDTIILASIDIATGTIDALAIPRDTRVRIPGRSGYDRINAAHVYGGPELAVRTVENLLGIDVDYYVRIDYRGFETIVDTLGGVVIDVERPMRYVDRAQGLDIDLKPGVQLLSGKQALDYVRYRDGLGDVSLVDPEKMTFGGRVERQLKFARALANQAFSARAIFSAPKLFSQLRGTVATDMPARVAFDLLVALQELPSIEVRSAVLPGTGMTVDGASYWVVNEPLARELVNKRILHLPGMVRVEVLNGSGESGVASRAADLLRTKGFEVVGVRNADRFDYSTTTVIAQSDARLAAQVATALGASLPGGGTTALPAVSSGADVTVIIGKDFRI